MPKTKKQGKKIDEEKLNELGTLFQNLKHEKKETGDGSGEQEEKESELEEEVDDANLDLQALEFHQFMESQKENVSGSPVLERIAASQPRPIFVGGIPQGPTTAANEKSEDEFKYVSGSSGANEPKYFAEPGINQNVPERIDLMKAGRTNRADSFREEINQERFFVQSGLKMESPNLERFEQPGRFDFERERNKNPFEKQELKYEKYRPKVPKG